MSATVSSPTELVAAFWAHFRADGAVDRAAPGGAEPSAQGAEHSEPSLGYNGRVSTLWDVRGRANAE